MTRVLMLLAMIVPMVLGAFSGAAAAPQGFYVAVAPYVDTTHPCTYHAKGSCQAELKNTELRFWLRSTDGAVNRAGIVRTGSDGFVEWWLPHNKSYVVTFVYQGLRGTDRFGTFPKDRTCVTTTQLRRSN